VDILGLGSKNVVFGHFIVLFLLNRSPLSMFPSRRLSESGSCLYKAFLSVSSAMFNSRSPRPCQPKQEAYYCYCTLSLSLIHTRTHALSCSQVTVTVSKYGQRDGRVVTFLKSVFVQLYEACIPHCNHNVLGGAWGTLSKCCFNKSISFNRATPKLH